MKKLLLLLSLPFFCFAQTEVFLSLPKQKSFFQKIELPSTNLNGALIQVNPAQTFQSIDGFGFTLTGGSAQLIHRLEPARRATLLQELFGKNGISNIVSDSRAIDLDPKLISHIHVPRHE